jgi:hopanoid biosynthesis associated protein HpnK
MPPARLARRGWTAGRDMPNPIFSADDFGLTAAVNEAVALAHVQGVLTQASLMVGAPAAADAVARAKALPGLNVGLHLVLVDGASVLGHTKLPHITGPDGRFGRDQAALGVKYFFSRAARQELRGEIRAQFEAFAATGLKLHHADAHKHMHLHPTVAQIMIETGREFGLTRIRVPAESPSVMRRCGERPGFGDYALYAWSRVLRRQAGAMAATQHVFGLKWSGHMTQRLLNWKLRRAFALPYFLRSTTRLSRVRKPATFRMPRRSGS